MEKLEAIKTAHLIDQYLGRLATAVTDEGLKKKILTLHTEWRELAYLVSAHLSGVEASPLSSPSKKKVSRKKGEGSTDQASHGDGEGPLITDEGEAT